jgi:hypothetical protein
MTVSYKLLLYRLVTALFTTLSVLAAGLFLVNDTATANNPVIVRVVDADCKDPGKTWAYNSVDEAVMDTISLEWWPPSLIGGTVTFDSLKAAAVIVRSRILFHVRVPLNSAYNYSTANYDSRKPGELWNPACATGDAFTMNTNDSLHVGMNGQKLTGSVLGFGENMTGWSECGFAWRSETEGGGRPYLRPNFYDTNSAFQTVNIWMKEDGLYVDRIILTTDPSDKIFKQFIPFVLK